MQRAGREQRIVVMTSSSTSTSLAARAGRWSVRHRRAAILGWLGMVLAAVAIGGALGTDKLASYEKGVGESGRADKALHDAGLGDAAGETLLVTAPAGAKATDPATKRAIADLTSRVEASGAATHIRRAQISADGRSALVRVQLEGTLDDAAETVVPVTAAVDATMKAHPAVAIEQTGDGSVMKAFDKTLENDFKKAELISVPLTFLILFLAFGAVVAAGIPVLLGLSAVAAAMGLIAIPSKLIGLEESYASIVLLIGLAVGVDYALFYLRREREERAKGRTTEAAIEAAGATSGRAILVSGFTVMASVAGMFAAGSPWYTSYALGIILVVAIAMVGSVTVLPALMSKLGDNVERGRPRLLRRRTTAPGEAGRFWTAILDRVVRRPVASLLVAGALLLALAAPALDMRLAEAGMGSLPQDDPAVAAFEHAQQAFPGGSMPAVVAVQADDVTSPEARAAIAKLQPASVDTNYVGTVARVTVALPGSGVDEASEQGLAKLRDDTIPAVLASLPGARADVTGPTAMSTDLRQSTEDRGPLVFALVLGMGFLVLLVTFRSIVIPIKAIVLNLLSVGAAYGVLTLVFQHGWGADLLGFEPVGSIATWLPVLLFVILFGLSMDYHVFVLSRVREAFDRGVPMDQAVAQGIKSTAGTVTSAAAVMVAVFAIFATLGVLEMKQVGVGLATAIFIDATIVRAVLLPASMKLLGKWNWYLPSVLGWLPRIGGETAPSRI